MANAAPTSSQVRRESRQNGVDPGGWEAEGGGADVLIDTGAGRGYRHFCTHRRKTIAA